MYLKVQYIQYRRLRTGWTHAGALWTLQSSTGKQSRTVRPTGIGELHSLTPKYSDFTRVREKENPLSFTTTLSHDF